MDARDARNLELEDLRHVMSTPQGRRFMHRFLSDGRIFSTCFTGTSHTYYNEGRREFALRYFSDVLLACPERYTAMMQENHKPGDEKNGNAGTR